MDWNGELTNVVQYTITITIRHKQNCCLIANEKKSPTNSRMRHSGQKQGGALSAAAPMRATSQGAERWRADWADPGAELRESGVRMTMGPTRPRGGH